MAKTKIMTFALAGLMVVGITSITTFASPSATMQTPSITFNKEEKLSELEEKKATIELKKIEFSEKGAAFFEAMTSMESKLLSNGKTQNQIDTLLEKFNTKFDDLKQEKGVEIQLKQAERDANVAARTEKDVKKQTSTPINSL